MKYGIYRRHGKPLLESQPDETRPAVMTASGQLALLRIFALGAVCKGQEEGVMILAVISNKGGTGKSTTAVNLAVAFSLLFHKRTLLIDLDSQASASLSLAIHRLDLTPSIADVILEGRSLKAVIREDARKGLDLVTGAPSLANADLVLADVRGRERRLADAIKPLKGRYDFIILDCPPSLSMLVVNAMVCADAFIVPTPPEYLALEGLVGMMEAVVKLQKGIGSRCTLLGVLFTQVDHRRRITEEIIKLLRGYYKDKAFKTEIRVDVRLVEAPAFRLPSWFLRTAGRKRTSRPQLAKR